MAAKSFSDLSAAERSHVNRAQKQYRGKKRLLGRLLAFGICIPGFALGLGPFILKQLELASMSSEEVLTLEITGLAMVFGWMFLFVGSGLVYLIREGIAKKVELELTVLSADVNTHGDGSDLWLTFEELPEDEYTIGHGGSNWREHAELGEGSKVLVTAKRHWNPKDRWFYQRLCELKIAQGSSNLEEAV